MVGPVRYHGPWDAPTRRFGWLGTALIGGLLSLVLVWLMGLAALVGMTLTDPFVAVRRYVPPDATATAVQWDPGSGGARAAEMEHARFNGNAVLTSVAAPFLTRTEPIGEPALSAVRWWREVLRDDTGATPRTRLRSVTDQGILLHGQSWGDNGVTFSPMLVELPADPRDGDVWQSSGITALDADGPAGTYEHHGKAATPTDPGLRDRRCLVVTHEALITHADQTTLAWQEEATWCPGAGVVAETGRFGDTAYTLNEAGPDRGLDPVDGEARRADAADVATWQQGTFDVFAGDSTFGRQPVQPITMGPPAVSTSGGVFSRALASDDVTGSRPIRTPDGAFGQDWWARPGGTILGVSTLGDELLVATADRTLVAYTAGGLRRWTAELDDVVLGAPTRVGTDQVAIATLAGTVHLLDLADGRTVWTAETGRGISNAPVTDGRTVVVVDNDDELSGWDVATGDSTFSAEVFRGNPLELAVAGSTVLSRTLGDIDAYDITDGTRLWTRPVTDDTQFATAGDQLVTTGSSGTLALDADTQQVVWEAPAADALLAIDGGWALLSAESLMVVSSEGEQLRTWGISVDGEEASLVGGAGRVWVFSIVRGVELSGQWYGVDR